jgi:hypothetical protein
MATKHDQLSVGSRVLIRPEHTDGRRHFAHHARFREAGVIVAAPPESPYFVARFEACARKIHRFLRHELLPA